MTATPIVLFVNWESKVGRRYHGGVGIMANILIACFGVKARRGLMILLVAANDSLVTKALLRGSSSKPIGRTR